MHTSVPGSCLCGSIQFHFTLPSLWCSHCHCSMCRKAHGAGYVTWVGVVEEQFFIEQGEQALQWYFSSPEAKRGGCSECGSMLLFQSMQWPGEMHIAMGALDGEIDRKPAYNVYFDTHVSWMPIDQALPQKP